MSPLDFACCVGAPGESVGAAAALFQLAAGGRGMVQLASVHYGSADYELVKVAFHEAGHAIVARAFGCAAAIEYIRPRSGRTWLSLPSCDSARKSIAVAGSIAGHLAAYGTWVPDTEVQRICPDAMSDSDRILAGKVQASDIVRCAHQVRQHWGAIAAEASQALRSQWN